MQTPNFRTKFTPRVASQQCQPDKVLPNLAKQTGIAGLAAIPGSI
jgi:hypothetical protein